MKRFLIAVMPVADLLLALFTYPAAFLLGAIRRIGLHRLPNCKRALRQVGVLPIRKHYHEPYFDERTLTRPLTDARDLPGIEWNLAEQLDMLERFDFNHELGGIAGKRTDDMTYGFNNGAFESGDAEYLYNLIRLKKPSRIIEVGSGHSTLMANRATKKNHNDDPAYWCNHVCIEPYENPWLEKVGVTIHRERVEDVQKSLFSELGENDLLFIDSSHVIRPQGDVLFEYLELLPSLKKGVIVHVHDIFSPRDYLKEWVIDKVQLWNEQYLLEAFLTSNRDWKIIGALNYLKHNHFDQLHAKCPYLTRDREPGSFYLQKIA